MEKIMERAEATELVGVTRETYDLLVKKIKKTLGDLTAIQENIRLASQEGMARNEDFASEMLNEKQLQGILHKMKMQLKKVSVIPKPKDNLTVQVGSHVAINFGGKKAAFVLDGLAVANGFCSLDSPLGKKVKGAKTGDKFILNDQEVIILSIS